MYKLQVEELEPRQLLSGVSFAPRSALTQSSSGGVPGTRAAEPPAFADFGSHHDADLSAAPDPSRSDARAFEGRGQGWSDQRTPEAEFPGASRPEMRTIGAGRVGA